MHTTLMLDDDIAKALERLRRERAMSLDALINEILRHGLGQLQAGRPNRAVQTRRVDLGRCLIEDIADTSRLLTRLG